MKGKNIYWIVAGVLNLFTALLHTFGGQWTLVDPLLESSLAEQVKTEWVGVWHMGTAVLLTTTYFLLRKGWGRPGRQSTELVAAIGVLYVLFSLSFLGAGFAMSTLAGQWILLLPIGVLSLLGVRRSTKPALAV